MKEKDVCHGEKRQLLKEHIFWNCIVLVHYHTLNSGILCFYFNIDFCTCVQVTDCPKRVFVFIHSLLIENICVCLLLGRHFNIFFTSFRVIDWSDEGLELTKNDRLIAPPRQENSVQPPAPCRLSYEFRLTHSGLYPIKAWKLPRTDPAKLLRVTGPTVFIGKEVFFLFCLQLSCFNFCFLCLSLLLCTTVKSPSP